MTIANNIIDQISKHADHCSNFLVAVSGGSDSMALVDLLINIPEYKISVAHFQHGLRPDSEQDQKVVEDFCAQHQVQVFVGYPKENPPTANIESWARRERYGFLKKVREKENLDCVVTAHTRDDLTELFLMRLLANKSLRSMEVFERERRLLRPLLETSKEELSLYCAANRVPYRDDSTNFDNRFFRNKVRNQLLPVLRESFGSEVDQILNTQLKAIDQDIRFLDERVLADLNNCVKSEWGTSGWLVEVLDLLQRSSPAVRWRYSEQLLFPKLHYRVGRKHGERLVNFFLSNAPEIELPGGFALRRRGGGIKLIKSGEPF